MNAAATGRAAGNGAMPLLPLKLWKSQHLLLVRRGSIVKEAGLYGGKEGVNF
jgi:hypothetical protein